MISFLKILLTGGGLPFYKRHKRKRKRMFSLLFCSDLIKKSRKECGMLKKFGMLAFALAMGGMLVASEPAQAAKGFKHLSFMGGYMEKHPTTVNVFKPFIEATEKKFGGRLSFD